MNTFIRGNVQNVDLVTKKSKIQFSIYKNPFLLFYSVL